MNLFDTSTCDALPEVDEELVRVITMADRNAASHRALMRAVKGMHRIELGGEPPASLALPDRLIIGAWNLQRCLYPEQAAELLQRGLQPQVLLVSEMDYGMARTHQRHTTRALADCLGMRYAYGAEFFELGLGNEIERRLAADDHNQHGWHGNAILSSVALEQVALIRLDDDGHWFRTDREEVHDSIQNQPRVGGRCAIAAILPTETKKICVVSVHLENQASAAVRAAQMERLIAALDVFATKLPVVIGGDLNTHGVRHGIDRQAEPLFLCAERHGFSWQNNASCVTTRQSSLSHSPRQHKQLDWFCSRGMRAEGARIVPALDESGKALSDHDLILGQFAADDTPAGVL